MHLLHTCSAAGSSVLPAHASCRSAQVLAKLQKRIDELSRVRWWVRPESLAHALAAAQALLLAGPQEEADLLAALDTTHQAGSTTTQQSLEGHLLQELRRHLEQLRQEQQMAGTA